MRSIRFSPVATAVLAVIIGLGLTAGASADRPTHADGVTWGKEGTWAFQPVDTVAGGALDLRHLNETVAGEHGFIRLSEDGNEFVRGDGEVIKLWGVAAAINAKTSMADAEKHARFLAKVGCNTVRIGGAVSGLIPQEKGSAITDVNEEFLDTVWKTVAAMKKEGIYTRIAPFWDHGSVKYINPDWGIEGYKSGSRLNALLFFEPTLQKGFRTWMKRLFHDKNPYTGIPLKDDPAVAIVQIVSEDSMFFWWIHSIHGGPKKLLQEKFGEFAAGKYGSVEKAMAAWGGQTVGGDDPAAGQVALINLHNLHDWPGVGNTRRLNDQAEFLSRTERGFYLEMIDYFRDELGVKSLIGPSNFGPADKVRFGDLQRYSWAAGDVIEQNNFFGGKLKGQHAFWRIQPGHFLTTRSATRDPQIPALRKQVAGRPFVMSSTVWLLPNLYTAEGPVMQAAYSAMNGLDGMYWFSAQAPAYDLQPYFTFTKVQGHHPMKRWTLSTPGFLSQFPAAALIFRQGLVDPAETVVHEQRSVEEMYNRHAPLLAEEIDYDPAERSEQLHPAKRDLADKTDGRALLVGRAEVVYEGDPSKSKVVEIDRYIDEDTGEIRTTHGQLALDRRKGLLRIDSPKAQGVVGFLRQAGGSFTLQDMTIQSGNEYASIVAVPLDGAPLADSKRILVQVGTIALPTGWAMKPASQGGEEGYEITSTGQMPWRVAETDATVALANASLTRATRLDEMGFAAGEVPLRSAGDKVVVKLPANTMYLLLEAK